MDDGLKQRIVGAIVLVAIAMIFLPMMFDLNTGNNDADEMQIPSPPQINETASADPDKFAQQIPEVTTAAEHQQETWQEQDSATVDTFDEEAPDDTVPDDATPKAAVQTTTPEPVKIADNGLAKAWTLQVGVFGDKKNAQALSDKLLKKGYQSYVREIKDKNKSTFKVFVGPDLQKAHLSETKNKLLTMKKELQISDILLKPYQP